MDNYVIWIEHDGEEGHVSAELQFVDFALAEHWTLDGVSDALAVLASKKIFPEEIRITRA